MAGLDLTLLGMVGLGAFLGLSRGLTGEILSLLKLAVASIISVIVIQNMDSVLPSSGMSRYIASSVIGFIIFFVCSLFLGLITSQINFLLKAIIPGIINSPLGLVAGSGKMFIIASVVFYLGSNISEKFLEEEPAWIENAKSKELLATSGEALVGLFVGSEDIDLDSIKNSASDFGIDSFNKDSKSEDVDEVPETEDGGLSLETLKSLMPLLDSSEVKDNATEETEEVDEPVSEEDSSTGKIEELKKMKGTFDNLDGLLESLN